jgi:hypothetical protein
MNEIDQGNICLIEWMRLGSLGSMGPLFRLINRHHFHSKAILGVPKRRRFITRHGVRLTAPRGPASPPNCHTGRNRPKELTLNRLRAVIRSVQGERQWITGPAAPLDLAAPVILGPRAQPTPLLIEGTSHSLEWTHIAGASHFPLLFT